MHREIASARKAARLSQAEVAKQLHIALRKYQGIEYGSSLAPDIAQQLSKILRTPELTMIYCRQCPIGKSTGYKLLNKVDLSPITILAKYRKEAHEAHQAVEDLFDLLLNKKGAEDCTEVELAEIRSNAKELLDVEHVIRLLRMRLWAFVDMAELMREHHDKCLERGYYCNKKPALRAG